MRRILLASICLVTFSASAEAQVPVTDAGNLLEWAQGLANEIKAYALQVKQYVGEELSWAVQAQQYAMQGQQYLVEAEQLLAFVHNPTLGAAMGMLNAAGLGSSMPVSPYAVMGLVNGTAFGGGGMPNIAGIFGPLAALSGSSYAANHVYSPTDGSWNSQQLINSGNAIAGTQGTALASYQQLQTHEQSMQAIRDRLTTATTPKDVQDAQAEVELESLWTANQSASLAAVQIAAQTQDAARVQRDSESLDKGIDDFLAQAAAAGRGL
jgi:hypothetical protein